MNSPPRLTEAAIRERANDTSFQRGENYYRDGAVLEIKRRDNQIIAEVEGNDYDPYRISIFLNEHSIDYAECTCPYNWGGDCKHIVAVLLTFVRSEAEVDDLPSVKEMLDGLDRDQLLNLILELTEHNLDLIDAIQIRLPSIQMQSEEPSDSTSPRERKRPLDPEPFRLQVRNAFRSLDYMSPSEAYWNIGSVLNGILDILKQVRNFIDAGDGRNAIVILKVVTEEYMLKWTELDDSDGGVSEIFWQIGNLWAEAILTSDLTPDERKEWEEQLYNWGDEISDWGGLEDAFLLACEAAIYGWDHPLLQRILNGADIDLHEWDTKCEFHEELAPIRLDILSRQERIQEFLNLAEAEYQIERYVTMLVRLDRVQEAVDYAMENMVTANEAMALAKALYEHDEIEKAINIAEYGLKLAREGPDELSSWLRDIAASTGRSEVALKAALATMHEQPNLANYQAVQSLAGESWPELRNDILKQLRQMNTWYSEPRVRIFLHEGLLDDAISALGSYSDYLLIGDVADAAISERPEWVIEKCREQAEDIMNSGSSQAYHHAVKWLEKVRSAHFAAGTETTWHKYLVSLLEKHRRKYKLMPMLETLL